MTSKREAIEELCNQQLILIQKVKRICRYPATKRPPIQWNRFRRLIAIGLQINSLQAQIKMIIAQPNPSE